MSAAALLLFVGVFAVVAPLALYVFVRSEAENTERMSREEARERVSREQDDDRR
ncbi:hypothetical protein LPA44_09425 [Halobacterium sp. KA-4]|jgi:hypothetical protein|uniref:hypothetical protein n=1 Tax=Halobacterium sp. KA-4 TaxID=2896367 RepID=UPI001E6534CA|nr:hypothetical protein [Halobacterium sp. KA-4]MCD2200118.1 hypothetical protein [Halobacterium sp. KA-4]